MMNTQPKTARTEKRGNMILTRIVPILLSLLCVSTSLLSGLLARYTTSSASSDTAAVAAWVFSAPDGSDLLPLVDVTKPGDSAACPFTVKNYSGSVISEVAEQISINISAIGNMPLVIELYDPDADEPDTPIASADLASYAEDVTTLAVTDSLTTSDSLLAAVETGKLYTLAVEWPAERNEYALAYPNSIALLEFSVAAEQID